MLKIFVSSTFRDLSDVRSELLGKINLKFEGVGMEQFLDQIKFPDGKSQHQECISNIKNSDVVIFLISPYYGAFLESCSLKDDCKADCPMKTGEGHISYTHCEYKTTIAEGILHLTFLIDSKDWELIEYLNEIDKDRIEINEIKNKSSFSKFTKDEISNYIWVSKATLDFKREISKEFYRIVNDIEDPNIIDIIIEDLAEKILQWHTEKKDNFKKKIKGYLDNLLDSDSFDQYFSKNIEDIMKIYKQSNPDNPEDFFYQLFLNFRQKTKKKSCLVFISYATVDAKIYKIKNIVEYLKAYEEIEDAYYWEGDVANSIILYMDDSIGKCDVLILFCSKNALKSRSVKLEWSAAVSNEKEVIPVFEDKADIPPLLKSMIGLQFKRSEDLDIQIRKLHELILKRMDYI